MKLKKKTIILLTIILVLSGFGRDYIMVNINWIIKHLTLGAPNYAQTAFNPLLKWQIFNLILLKWILTAVFTAYFYLLTYFLIKYIFEKNIYLKYVRNAYVLLVAISVLIFVFGYVTNLSVQVYPAVRALMGLAQSFIPFIILYLLLKFTPNRV